MNKSRNKRKDIARVRNKTVPVSADSPVESGGKAPNPKQRFFTRFDWIVAGVTGLAVFIGYLFSLAPNVTLEDSGELAVASYYAGVPHSPGYPIWTIYSWLFTVLVPISNIAFRVALSSAVAGACSCGLLALMVCRGSGRFLESVPDFQKIGETTQKGICGVSGWMAGMLMGFNGFMWSQAVIVEVYPLSVLSLVGVLVLMMRWMYEPERRKYLYFAFFLFGICFTNHQSLVVTAIGLEIAIAAVNKRLGRDLFLGNAVVYAVGLIAKFNGHIHSFDETPTLFLIFNLVGIGSIVIFFWLWSQTQKDRVLSQWRPASWMLLAWLAGVSFYFFMPLASATNPPMNWAYPRTWDGFIHALTRGQYSGPSPTNELFRFVQQMWGYFVGAGQEFNPIMLLLAIIPFVFFRQLKSKDRSWMIGLSGIFFCLAVILMVLLNPPPDRQAQELNRVFFTPSHTLLVIWIGYGTALVLALMATHFRENRSLTIVAGAGALVMALYLVYNPLDGYPPEMRRVHPLDIFTSVFLVLCTAVFFGGVLLSRSRPPVVLALVLFAVLPIHSITSHWWKNEKAGHLFGYWFGHDMFEPPFGIYPSMAKGAVLYGGTDPGRFVPTYMIFCESFIPSSKKPLDPEFDRRDVYLITQNALADHKYLDYIRAHYFRSDQQDPPFFQDMLWKSRDRQRNRTNFLARIVAPFDRAMMSFGAMVEESRRKRGVYPPDEIYTPTSLESDKVLKQYFDELKELEKQGMSKPFSQREAVNYVNNVLTEVIFHKNPDREFYVEESFPLPWMFSRYSPYGLILRLNREPVPRFTQEVIDRDLKFWDLYLDRLIGSEVVANRSLEELITWSQRVYILGDLSEYPGNSNFLRDSWAQKTYSKLRCAVAGMYTWRLLLPENSPFSPGPEDRRMLETAADVIYRQALALCPYSSEVGFRYATFLSSVGRFDDADLVVDNLLIFDVENQNAYQIKRDVIERFRQQAMAANEPAPTFEELERRWRNDPQDLDAASRLIAHHIQAGNSDEYLPMLKTVAESDAPTKAGLLMVCKAYLNLGRYAELETALIRFRELVPDNNSVLFDLAATRSLLGKTELALSELKEALEKEQPGDDGERFLLQRTKEDVRFEGLYHLEEFQRLVIER